jgi:hypothetical protein
MGTVDTPWSRARGMKYTKQEDDLGKLPGGSKQVNSGRHWRWKRDGKLFQFLVECRTTDKESYRIEKKEFQDLRRQALKEPMGCHPGMQIDIQEVKLWVMDFNEWYTFYIRYLELEALVGSNDKDED